MGYIQFDKNQLVNLEYVLSKELIRSNRAGAYSSTTIIGCNTRKYHGLLVCPQPAIDNDLHVLLSSLDETVIQNDAEFNLGIRRYPGVYNPKGHKYIVDFDSNPIPATYYRVGGVSLKKEMLFASDNRLLVKYTLLEAHSQTKLRVRPFLAYRNFHKLSKANHFVDKRYSPIENGIKTRMYQGYDYLCFQFSKAVDYIHVPDWYYNVEYLKELARGYEGHEDLFTPGYFEFLIKKGESVVLSVGTEETSASALGRLYSTEVKKRVPRDNFYNCLQNAAQQFIVKQGKKVEVIAGYPWFGSWGRDTFISLPGLTLVSGDYKSCKAAMDNLIANMRGPLFSNVGDGPNASYNSADASLWFFWTLQQYKLFTGIHPSKIWDEYGVVMKTILYGYRNGADFGIRMDDNGLLHAGQAGYAVTWMDAVVNGKAVTPRIGYPVEINALWYNAMMFALEMAVFAEDEMFVADWLPVASQFPVVFKEHFWDKSRGYVADYTNGDFRDFSVRPNMIFACSLPFTPLSEKIRQLILERVEKELLTPRGLRTLSPKNPAYSSIYAGDQATRDSAYHQGTVWPWLLGHFVEGYLRIHGKSGLPLVKKIFYGMEETMTEHGLGTISEVFDGDPPFKPGGTISQAWSVAEMIRIKWLMDKVDKTEDIKLGHL